MKQLLIGAIIFCFAGTVSAQSNGGGGNRSSSTTGASSTGSNTKTKSGTAGKRNKTKAAPLNESKEYQWKNGQKATPAGQEATPTNGGYASLKKDTAAKPVKNKQRR